MTGDYKAYLLRLQRGKTEAHWRATLVDAHSGKEQHFATERALLIHLLRTFEQSSLQSEESENKKDKG